MTYFKKARTLDFPIQSTREREFYQQHYFAQQ